MSTLQCNRDYWAGFSDFVACEVLAAGPSPNLKMIGAQADALGLHGRVDRAWLACCYAAIYNTSGASALFHHWSAHSVLHAGIFEVTTWLSRNSPGLPVHSNRLRTHGSPRKMAEGLLGLAEFSLTDDFERGDDYDRLWKEVRGIAHVGRYFGIKLAGTLHELGLTEAAQYDIRAAGAKNGRRTLALLHPEHFERLSLKTGGNSPENVALVDRVATSVKDWLRDERDLCIDWFQFEALLCEANQCVKGARYPGKTSDADLGALDKASDHFGESSPEVRATREARRRTLPPELVDSRKREDLLGVYAEHDYMWSDAIYDYDATTDLAKPVSRGDAKALARRERVRSWVRARSASESPLPEMRRCPTYDPIRKSTEDR